MAEASPITLGEVPTKNKRKMSQRERGQYWGVLWILPAFLMLAVFCLYPVITAFGISFTNWDGPNTEKTIVWFDNFAAVLNDTLFWRSLWNVVILTVVGMLLGNAANLILAELMFNLRSKLTVVYRFLFVLPAMVPSIVVMLLWQQLILHGSEASVMNKIIGLFGAKPMEWLESKDTVIVFISIFIYGFPWMGGTSFLIYLAGLNSIDESVIEASRLDGLGTWGRVFYIDFPLLKGQIKYFLVMGFIGGLQNYSMQFAITDGGPGETMMGLQSGTMVPGYYIYSLINGENAALKSLGYGKYGYACAIGIVMFVIIMVVTVVNNKLVKSEE